MTTTVRLASAVVSLAAAALVAAPAPSDAAPIVVAFSGTVSSVFGDDSSGDFAAAFSVGQAVSGSFTFDSAAVGVPFGAGNAAYAATFSATVGATNVSGNTEYRIFDDDPGAQDGWSIVAENGAYSVDPATPVGSMFASTFFLQFLGMPGGTLASSALVLDPGAIAPTYNPFYAPHGFRLDNRDGTFGAAYFQMDSVTLVPEPGSLALLLASLGLLARSGRGGVSRALRTASSSPSR